LSAGLSGAFELIDRFRADGFIDTQISVISQNRSCGFALCIQIGRWVRWAGHGLDPNHSVQRSQTHMSKWPLILGFFRAN
jgi:hypothetical protein